jgi:hypothetical protein
MVGGVGETGEFDPIAEHQRHQLPVRIPGRRIRRKQNFHFSGSGITPFEQTGDPFSDPAGDHKIHLEGNLRNHKGQNILYGACDKNLPFHGRILSIVQYGNAVIQRFGYDI